MWQESHNMMHNILLQLPVQSRSHWQLRFQSSSFVKFHNSHIVGFIWKLNDVVSRKGKDYAGAMSICPITVTLTLHVPNEPHSLIFGSIYPVSFIFYCSPYMFRYTALQFCNKIPLCQSESLFGGFINFKPMQPRPESRRCWDKEVFLWWLLWLLVITIFNIMNILGKACLLSESRYPTPRSYFARAAHRTYNPISPSSSWTL